MQHLLARPGATCQAYGQHRPAPLRIIRHHILPQVCGGKTVPENLLDCCDGCHYAIHALLFHARRFGAIPRVGSAGQRRYALAGYNLAAALNTIHLIPDEGQLPGDLERTR